MSDSFEHFDFLNYYKAHRSDPYVYRCLACHYVQSGKHIQEVSELFQYTRQSIREWVSRFKTGGLDALLSISPGRGRHSILPDTQYALFAQAVVALQDTRNGGRVIGEDIIELLKERFHVTYSLPGVYALLSRIGLSWVSSRSVHPKVNVVAQKAFKKTSLTQ